MRIDAAWNLIATEMAQPNVHSAGVLQTKATT
jgi:hypothetical protein